MTSKTDLLAAMPDGEPLGDIVFIRLKDPTVKRDRLLELAKNASLPEDLIPDGLTKEQAFQAALRGAHAAGFLTRPILKDDRAIVWGAVRETVHAEAKELAYQQETRLAFLRATETTAYEDQEHPVCQEAEKRYQSLIDAVTPSQIQGMIWEVCKRKGNGIQIGTSWFVPAASSQLVRSMQRVIEKLGDSEVWLLPIARSPEATSAINRAVKASIETEIEELQGEIEGFSEATRSSTMEKRIELFSELRQRAKLYAGILSVTQDDILQKIEDLEKKLSEMLGIK